jgi:iron complex outermembrane receptor protein
MLFISSAVYAQTAGVKLEGTVTDAQGKSLVNALVIAMNDATGATKSAHTDSNGYYSIDALAAGTYSVKATASGFAVDTKNGIVLAAGATQFVALPLSISTVAQEVIVNAGVDSIAAETAPSGGFLEERSAQSIVSNTYIENFTSPIADYGEIVQIVPGTFTLSADGVGLGQSKTYFRGFVDGDYDIDFDGIPFFDTNSPSHHSWAFFPSQWVGGVDFDRSPGTASTTGPTPFGGSIHLLSKPLTNELDIRGTVSYGTWNTKLYDGAFNSGSFGLFGSPKKSNLFIDVHHMSSDGYQTFNFNRRDAGSILYQYQFSPRTVLTGFSGVIQLRSNAPGFSQFRCQAYGAGSVNGNPYTCTGIYAPFVGAGIKFLLTDNSDPVNWLDYQYNTYHVPTDFEYVSLKTEFGKGWYLEAKPYTYNYDNAELFTNATPITESATVNGSKTYNGVAIAPCNVQVAGVLPCGVDKYNSYRKYGETLVVTQTSKLGVLRTGMWYEWARTDRHQYPSDPLNNWADQTLPNFAEQFWTNSYQPYGEFELHATDKLNITAGVKFSDFNFDVLHHADDGATVGNLCPVGQTTGCPTTVTDTGNFTAWLPSLDANYRIRPDWSVYGQVSTGSIEPPSNVYDFNHTISASNPKPGLATPPKQQKSTTYQIGSVMKLPRFTLDADAYRIRFQNSYSSVVDSVATDATFNQTIYFLQPSSVTQGVEFESNMVLATGLSAYLNATAANAYYSGELNAGTAAAPYFEKAPSGLWIASTPTDTEMQGLTYQNKGMDLGIFNKRVGEQRVDNKAFHNQAIVAPFSSVSSYINYTIRNHSIFDQTKIRLSANNLLDSHSIQSLKLGTKPAAVANPNLPTGDTEQFNATTGYTSAGADQPGIMAGRSFTVSVTFGFAPSNRK